MKSVHPVCLVHLVCLVRKPESGTAPPSHLQLRSKFCLEGELNPPHANDAVRVSATSPAGPRIAPVALHRLRHDRDPQSAPNPIASPRSGPAKIQGTRETFLAWSHRRIRRTRGSFL